MADCRTCPSLTLFRRRSALAKIPAQRCAAAWANAPNSDGREEQPIFKYFFGWFRLFRLFRLSWFSERHQFLLGKGVTTPGQQHTAAYIPLPMWRSHFATLPRCQVMVRNIPKACSREAIVELLSPCGLANRRRDDVDGPMGDYSRGTGWWSWMTISGYD
jgi:hypothetical protein